MNHEMQREKLTTKNTKRKAYPEYKPSGVEWLGDVPEHWGVKRLKYSSNTIMGQSPSSDEYSDDSDLTPFLQGNADFTDRFPTPRIYCETANKIVAKGSLLISVRAPVGALNEADQSYGIGRGLCAVVPKTELFKEYAWYTLQVTREELNTLATGSTYDAVSADEVGNMVFPLPPLPEQQTTASFLDRETGRIDTLIGKKKKLVELLKEKRTALISRAVTKGLDASVKLKPSGVDWLGEVPEHWEVKRLKNVVYLKSGDGITVEEIKDDAEYPVYGGNGFRGFTNKYTHDGEFVLIGRQGALCGNINYAHGKFWASEHAVVATPSKPVATFWLGELLRIMNLNQYSISAAQPGLAIDRIKELILPTPPLSEQQAIAAFLDRETARIDTLVSKVETAIEKLKEYRTALISAAVTGKIDIRKEVAV